MGFWVGSVEICEKALIFELKWTFIPWLIHSSSPFTSFGVRVQSSLSCDLILVSSTGGCGGFFFSWRFIGTTGEGSGGIPSDDETCAGGGFGLSSGGGSGGCSAALAATMSHDR